MAEVGASDGSEDLVSQKVIELNDGTHLPVLGFGTFQMSPEQCLKSVKCALETGYVHIDTAQAYRNQEAIGKVIKEFCEANGKTRDHLFVTTKMWPGGIFGQPKSNAEGARKFMTSAYEKLGIGAIDLVLIHGPFAGENRVDIYAELQKCKSEGLCKSVGVSNYGKAHIEEIKNAELPLPSVNQIEIHPLNHQADLVEYCKSEGIALTAYASLAPMSNWRKGDNNMFPGSKSDEDNMSELLTSLEKKYEKSQGQILLRWAVQKGYSILPKSNTPSRIQENWDLNFELSKDDMKAMDGHNKDRFVSWKDNFNPTVVP